jgi:hypothetical protein
MTHLASRGFIVLQEIMPSKRPTILLRLDEDAKAALIKAAKADDRSAQYILEKIVIEWLREKGYLQKGKTGELRNTPVASSEESDQYKFAYFNRAADAVNLAFWPDEAPKPDQKMLDWAQAVIDEWTKLIQVLKEKRAS